MKFNWGKMSKVVSYIVTLFLLITVSLPAIVLAEEPAKGVDSSFIQEEDSSIDSSVIDSSEDPEVEDGKLEEPIESSDTKESVDSTIIDSSKIIQQNENSESINDEQLIEEENLQENDKEEIINETDSEEEIFTEDSEEIFSLEENRKAAMKVLAGLQNNISMFSARAAVPATTTFINELALSAVQLGNKNGLYPSVMIAQAILETGWGGSTLSKAPNYNLFGIKGNYNGKTIKMLTSEYTEAGKKIKIYDNFKVYPSYKESFQDYVDFIRNTKGITRYKNVWRENASTYQKATAGLVSGGYATDPAYAVMLNNLISYNNLDRYDNHPTVTYSTHVQDKGWTNNSSNGSTNGTTGENKRIEAIKINLNGFDNLNVEYSSHVQDNGWVEWAADGNINGTTGQKKRIEAIKIKLTGQQASNFDIYYRVHSKDQGWLGWAKNGSESGTVGYGLQVEAIQIKIVPKNGSAPGSTQNAYLEKAPNIGYTTHLKNKGWQNKVFNGKLSGTIGESRRIEAIQVNLSKLAFSGNVLYSSHIQDYGWGTWATNGSLSGTIGKSKQVEAIKLKLSGEIATKYDIYYRSHIQDYGWLGWTKNGTSSGTEGLSKRMEAIEIKLVKKGGSAPGNTTNVFIKR